jgi:hypothetical protein
MAHCGAARLPTGRAHHRFLGRLRAELNFYRLFDETIEHFSMERVGKRQAVALAKARL